RSLAADDFYTQTATLRQLAVSPGDYYLLFVADDGLQVGQETRDGNVASKPITLGYPDLSVSDVAALGTATASDTIGVTWKVSNDSDFAVKGSGPWVDAVYVSDRPTFDNPAVRLGAAFAPTAALAAKGEYPAGLSVTLPVTLTSGDHYLFVRT